MRFKQRDTSDCGPTCIAYIAHHYHRRIPIARIRQVAGTDQTGTTALGLIEAAEQLGFRAKGVKGTFDCLSKIPKPAIAHLRIGEDEFHFLVLLRMHPRWIEVMDPVDGRRRRHSHERFREQWTGILALLAPTENVHVNDHPKSTLWRFCDLIKPHRGVLTQAFIGSLLATLQRHSLWLPRSTSEESSIP